MSEIVIRAKVSLSDILDMVRQLKPEERRLIYEELEKEVNDDFATFLSDVREKYNVEPISDQEITKAVEEVRNARYQQRIKGSL